jgi:peptidoglycan/LPS O-acetylase OafA/YrhL
MWRGLFPTVDHINSVYWTLVVEVQFYLIAAVIFWGGGRRNFSRNLVIFTVANILVRAAVKRLFPDFGVITYQIVQLTDFMPWFGAGAIFFELFKMRFSRLRAAVLLTAMFLIIIRTSTFSSGNI